MGIKYARTVTDKYADVFAAKEGAKVAEGPILLGDETGFGMPENFMRWNPTCHHNHHLVEFGKEFMALTKKQYLYMMYVWGHSFEFTRNNNWNVIEEFFEKTANISNIWYATNIEVYKYVTAYRSLVYSADWDKVYNPSSTDVWVKIDGKAVSVPAGKTVNV